MGPGPVVETICFMLLMVTLVVVGVYVLAYVARCVLVVVQETGLGQDAIVWPSEPFQDWLLDAVLFIELLGLWIFPAGLAARMLRRDWLVDEGVLRVLLLAGPGLWLFFPVGLLSSLSSLSRWVPLRWRIVALFLRIAPSAAVFYAVTAVLLGLCAAVWYYTLVAGHGILLLLAGPLTAAVLLVYARLLGRLAWLIQRLPGGVRLKSDTDLPVARPDTPAEPRRRRAKKKKRKPAAEVHDPWAVPEEGARPRRKKLPWEDTAPPRSRSACEPPSAFDIEAYAMGSEATPAPPPEPARPKVYPSPEEYEPVPMQPLATEEANAPSQAASCRPSQEEIHKRLIERERHEDPPPKHPLFSGVYTFPWYPSILPQWGLLSLGTLGVGFIVQQLVFFARAIFG
jgi:hypothetical protein